MRLRSPEVTLLVPTRNAGPEFPQIFADMRAQQLDRSLEILVIDSGSRDGTVEFLRRQPVRLIEIAPSRFDHGLTRHLGIREARGDIVVLASQDARPADRHWLQRLVDCFADPSVAGAYSRQVPRHDASPVIRDRLARWAAGGRSPRVQCVESPHEFEAMMPLEKLAHAAFDNVSSSVRRSTALEIPFRASRFGEDLDWGRRALLAGHKIVYEPRSCVVHSHDTSMWGEFTRVYLDHHNLHRLFGVHTVPDAWHLARCTAGGAVHLLRVVAGDTTLPRSARHAWYRRALGYSFAQSLAQFLGARSVAKLQAGDRAYRYLDELVAGTR